MNWKPVKAHKNNLDASFLTQGAAQEDLQSLLSEYRKDAYVKAIQVKYDDGSIGTRYAVFIKE